jgi:signal peptidase I
VTQRMVRFVATTARRLVVTLAALAVLVGLGSVLAISAANHGGYQVLGMKTGSMRPAIEPGDLVVAERVASADIRTGDVITFRAPTGSHAPYTHRVIGIQYGARGPELLTQGDANAAPDRWTVRYLAEGWRVVRVIPRAGLVVAYAQSPTGRRIVAASVFVLTLALLWPVFAGTPATPGGPRHQEVVA